MFPHVFHQLNTYYRIVFPGVGSTDYDDEEYSDGDYDEDDADKNETKNDIMLGAGASDRKTAKTPLKGPLTYDGCNNLGFLGPPPPLNAFGLDTEM